MLKKRNAQNSQSSIKVRLIIMVPFTAVLLFISCAIIYSDLSWEADERARDLDKSLREVQQLFRGGLENDARMMQAVLLEVVRDHQLQSAFLAGDPQALLDQVTPRLEAQQAISKITHFYFVKSNREVMLRAHASARRGDTINRLTMLDAERTGRVAHGIELGKLGTFTLRVVMPWYEDNQLIGYVELGEEIVHIVDKLKSTLDVDIVTTIFKYLLERKNWEEGQKFLGRQVQWNSFDEIVVTGSTIETLPVDIDQVAAEDDAAPDHDILDRIAQLLIERRNQELGVIPLVDYGDRHVGSIVVIQDVSRANAAFYTLLSQILFLTLSSGGVLFALFYFILGWLQRQIFLGEQDLIEAKSKAEAATDAKSQFLASMSH